MSRIQPDRDRVKRTCGPLNRTPGITASDRPADACRPTHCALGTKAHAHCVCGLPMAQGAALCDLCLAEGLQLDQVATPISRTRWDGSYPSRRLRWPADVPAERYEDLIRLVLAPASRPSPANAREAA